MKTGIYVCGRDINLPRQEWGRLMWGEPPNKNGSLLEAIAVFLNDYRGLDDRGLLVLGNGCIPGKNKPEEIGFTKKYLFENLRDCNIFAVLKVIEIGRIVNNTAEEIVEAARLFAEAGITRIFMVTCGSQIARATMHYLANREAGLIPPEQQWFTVADDMFYNETTASDVVVVEPPHRTDDPLFRAPLKAHELFGKFFKIPPDKRLRLLLRFKVLLEDFGV